MSRFPATVGLLAVLTLCSTACGEISASQRVASRSGQGLTDDELGRCVGPSRPTYERWAHPLYKLLGDPTGWIEVRSLAPPRDDDDADLVEVLAKVKDLRKGTSASRQALLTALRSEHLTKELAAGHRVVAHMTEITPGGEWLLGPAWVLRPDGSAAAVGSCAVKVTRAFNAFADARRAGGDTRTRRQILLDVFHGSPQTIAAIRQAIKDSFPPPTSWWDLAAAERTSHDAPPELRSQWTSSFVYLRLPESWRGFDATLCTRFEDAWNQCASPAASQPGRDIGLQAYRRPGSGIEVWVLDRGATLGTPLGRVQTIPAAAFDTATPLILTGDPTIHSVDALLARGRSGPPPFTPTPGPALE